MKCKFWGEMCSDGTIEMIRKYPGLTLRSFARLEINIMLPSSRKSYHGKETTTALNSVLIDTMTTVDL